RSTRDWSSDVCSSDLAQQSERTSQWFKRINGRAMSCMLSEKPGITTSVCSYVQYRIGLCGQRSEHSDDRARLRDAEQPHAPEKQIGRASCRERGWRKG